MFRRTRPTPRSVRGSVHVSERLDHHLRSERRTYRKQMPANTERYGTFIGSTRDDHELGPRNDLELRQIAQHFRIVVAHSHDPGTVSCAQLVQREIDGLVDEPFTRRNWRAMRIDERLADRRSHPVDKLIGRSVLQALCFIVNAIPRIMKRLREISLDHAMTPDRAQSSTAPGVSQSDAAIS